MALIYHAGQREVQTEANTIPTADRLANWVKDPDAGIPEFIALADLILLATPDARGVLRFQSVSGRAPLVDGDAASEMRLPRGVNAPPAPVPAGGIAINLEERRRARLNGTLVMTDEGPMFSARETFYNCRKYIAPSSPIDDALHIGPVSRRPVALDDLNLVAAVARVETAFLASVGEAGLPDVSHRGGARGFISLDTTSSTMHWSELIGNGMLKSAGNVRANGTLTLLVLDVETGDAYELSGRGTYETKLRYDEPRSSGLWPHHEDFPVQGEMSVRVTEAWRLQSLIRPRRKLEDEDKVTSCSPVEDQVPR
ncbi:MAG TPA: pyridoxamine 5'-phosphate oxidase family protein [Dehalococcoidia bacterium]|nr:pyridoxamine 5'-phosphate oxidase family protein [Dehalococcoidia bacterium]